MALTTDTRACDARRPVTAGSDADRSPPVLAVSGARPWWQLAALIASAKERYDFVLFDSPPLLAVTDAAVLASRVDGVVLVIKGEAIPRELLCQAMAMLADVKATVVGGVLNMVDVRRDRSYYYRLALHKYYGHQKSA